MTRTWLMAHRTSGGVTEAEPVIVDVTDDGRLTLELDDGQLVSLDLAEVLAVAIDELIPADDAREAA